MVVWVSRRSEWKFSVSSSGRQHSLLPLLAPAVAGYCMSLAFMRSSSACLIFLYLSRPVPQSPKNRVFYMTKGNKYLVSEGIRPLAKRKIVPARIKTGIIPPQKGLLNFVHKRYSAIKSIAAIINPTTNSNIFNTPFNYALFEKSRGLC